MVRRDTRSAENERGCTRHRSARRCHRHRYFSRRKQFVRDQAGLYRWHSSSTSFIEHDCELGKPDDVVAFNDPNGIIANGKPKSNTGQDSASRVKTDLRTGATLSGGGKTFPWSRTKLGQFPRFLEIWSFRRTAVLVSKMTDSSENHRHLALIGSCNHLLIAH